MELNFKGGKFVASKGELNYKEVLKDFPLAKTIRIVTYNISKSQNEDRLISLLEQSNADIRIITNIPSRMERYYTSPRGEAMRLSARENIHVYLSKLDPSKFRGTFMGFFNNHNHAKIIGTEKIVYIGSANYSNESADNYETGVIIEDKVFIQNLYSEFFGNLIDSEDTVLLYNESFSVFQIFLYSLTAKFEHHHHKFVSDVYTSYESTEMTLADPIFLDMDDLNNLYNDLDELESLCNTADDTYDEENEEYNCELEKLKKRFNRLSIDWMKSIISEDGTLYELVNYNSDEKTNEILQKEYYAESWDENLDHCIEMSMEAASTIYYKLHDDFESDAAAFISEMEKILSLLNYAISFTKKWAASKINKEIDNT